MGAKSGGSAPGTRLTLSPCTGALQHEFTAYPTSGANGAFTLRPRHAQGVCVSVESGSTRNGAGLVLEQCGTGLARQAFLARH